MTNKKKRVQNFNLFKVMFKNKNGIEMFPFWFQIQWIVFLKENEREEDNVRWRFIEYKHVAISSLFDSLLGS